MSENDINYLIFKLLCLLISSGLIQIFFSIVENNPRFGDYELNFYFLRINYLKYC